VRCPAVILSISPISEVLFILAIPFVMRQFGINAVMFIGMIAWTLRFRLFAFGDPVIGLWVIVLCCVVYGVALNFFGIAVRRGGNRACHASEHARPVLYDDQWFPRAF